MVVRGTILCFVLLALGGCRITDHSERDGEVSPSDIAFPASGYEDVDPDDRPAFEFNETHFDMGKVVQGTKVDHVFTFRNSGGSALVITDVYGSCGCTVSKDWPKSPVKPGEEGSISVTFNSEGLSGQQSKTVTVVANTTPPSHVLTLSGEVLGPANVTPIE